MRLTPQQTRVAERLPIKRKVLVPSANEVGKCVGIRTYVTLADGTRVRAGDLIDKKFRVLAWDGSKTVVADAIAESNGKKPIVRIETESGYVLEVTENHPLFAGSIWSVPSKTPKVESRGWQSADLLRPGDLLACPTELPVSGGEYIPDDELKLLAYMIGDGGMTTNSLTFTQMPGKQFDEFVECCDRIGCKIRYNWSTSQAHQIGITGKVFRKNPLIKLLEEHGLAKKHSRDKKIPDRIFQCSRGCVSLFLSRLYSTDGWASVQKSAKRNAPQIGFCSVSEELCRGIQSLLIRFAVRSKLRYRANVNAWCLEILSAESVENFCLRIGIYGKEEATERVLRVAQAITRRDKWRTQAAPAGFYWQRIAKVELTEAQETVAICVPKYENYVNEVLEHNSFLGACIALHHYDCFVPGITIVTAPADKQLTEVLFRELRVMSGRREGWKPQANYLGDAPNHFMTGLVAKSEEPFKGRHESHVLGMFDEAEGIELPFWDAGATMFDWWVCFYNPTLVSSPAASAERHQLDGVPVWDTIRLSALDHPNVAAALEGKPIPFPKAVTLEKIKDRLARWATKIDFDEPSHPDDIILDGTRWRLGPVAQPRILGIRPTGSANSVFSEGLWQKLVNARKKLELHWPLQLGVDVARYGDDFTVICIRRGVVCLALEKHNGWTTVQTAQRIKDLIDQHGTPAEDCRNIPVLLDDCGVGGGCVDQAGDHRFIPVNSGWRAEREDEYVDTRSQLWFDCVELVDKGEIDISRLSPDLQTELRDQLLSPLYHIDKRGRRYVEPKDATKKRLGGGSPDLADAFVLAFSPAASHFESYSVIG